MNEEKEPRAILGLIPQIMREVGTIPRNQRNRQQNYRYRGIDDLQNALQPALCKLGVTTTVRARELVIERWPESKAQGHGERQVFHASLLLDVLFVASDSSSALFTGAGEGIDYSGDKATAKAMVAAYKYAITLGLCIPVEDTTDSDRDPKAERPLAVEPPAVAAATPRQLVTTQQTDAYAVGPDQPCLQAQQDEIKQLAAKMQPVVTAHDLKAIVEKRGVQTLAQLTSEQAAEIIGRLEQKFLEQEAATVF